ncbi:hypothetical protein D7M10_11785 [Pseudomonas fluorescens]|nr:hypothetical protein D7M10_11785 [Pseudomonas fluorescens]
MSKNNGGPAFARPKSPKGEYTDSDVPSAQTGMSLRDYFAAKALSTVPAYSQEDVTTWSAEDFARHAYALADAMLAARSA